MSTPFMARVERVYFVGGNRRFVAVLCPFCWQSHEHEWPRGQSRPSSETLASCSPIGELSTYAIDPASAREAASKREAATAGQTARTRVRQSKR